MTEGSLFFECLNFFEMSEFLSLLLISELFENKFLHFDILPYNLANGSLKYAMYEKNFKKTVSLDQIVYNIA